MSDHCDPIDELADENARLTAERNEAVTKIKAARDFIDKHKLASGLGWHYSIAEILKFLNDERTHWHKEADEANGRLTMAHEKIRELMEDRRPSPRGELSDPYDDERFK